MTNDNNFNNTVKLEVETTGAQNMLVVSANSDGSLQENVFPTVTNPEFATNTTGWTAGTGWTLTRLTGPTRGHLVKSANVAAGSLIVQNTQQFAALPNQIWGVEISTARVSTTAPVGVDMQLRINLVAYNSGGTRLGIVTGYDGVHSTDPDAGLTPGDATDYSFTPLWSNPTPAGTTNVRFEILAHNAWTYVATAFQLDLHGLVPFMYANSTPFSGGWTATNGAVFGIAEGGWRMYSFGTSQSYFESDKVVVTPGKKIAVAGDVNSHISIVGDQIGVRYYDGSNVFLSESLGTTVFYPVFVPVTDQLGNSYTTPIFVRASYSHVVPVGAAKAALVFKPSNSSWSLPHDYAFCVMITGDTDEDIVTTSYADTVSANASNRIMNPSGELGVQGWTDYDANSVITTRNNLPSNWRNFDFRFGNYPPYSTNETGWNWEEPVGKEIIVAQAAAGYNALYSNTTEVTAGQYVGGGVIAKGRGYFPASGAYIISYVAVGWQFRNAADTVISTVMSDSVLVQNDYYRVIKAPSTVAPAGTVRARMVIQNSPDSIAFNTQRQSGWMMIKRAQMNVGASSISVTNQPFAYAEHWKDILGGTHEIGIEKDELNTGIMTAEIVDPTLDPAEFDILVPGKKARLRALVDGVWQTRFDGTITNCSTTYDVDRASGVLTPRITMEVADPTVILATTLSPNTVNTINGLANNMPSDIRWNINGQTAIGANPTVVAVNPQATTLDQVMITRDTIGGYAWVDRTGVFNAYDAFGLQKKSVWFSDQQKPTATDRNENLVLNPTFNTGTSTWTAAGGALSYDSPNKAAKVTATGGVPTYLYATTNYAVHEGDAIQGYVDASAPAGKGWQGHFIFYNSSSTEISRLHTNGSGQITGTVPASAVSMRLAIDLFNTASSGNPVATTVLTVNAAAVVVAPDNWNYVYFDGDSEYAYWTGTVNASTSVRDYSLYQDYLTNIELGYNTGEVINQVTIKVPTKNAEGTYDDVTYGPYQDTTSIADWGPKAIEMTIAGGVTPATVGARILASNADPELTLHSITFQVDDTQSFNHAALIDLYDQVWVRLTGKLAKSHRVAGMSHSIRATIKNKVSQHRWDVTLFFKALDTAALVTGGAPSSSTTTDPGPVYVNAYLAANSTGFPDNAYTTVTGWTIRESSGVSYSAGVWTILKSGVYLVTSRMQFTGTTGSLRGIKANVNNTAGPTALAASGPSTGVVFADYIRLVAGNTIRFQGFQNSGGTVTMGGDSAGSFTACSFRWVGE